MAHQSFDQFYKDLKETEEKDSVLTPRQQIDRLLRPGSTYRNLNPYEVLQVDPDAPLEDVKKKYRRLSILVHPDKNQDDLDRAQAAFDAVKKAYGLLENEETRRCCYDIVEEARGRTRQNMEEKRRRMRKEASAKGQDPNKVVKFTSFRRKRTCVNVAIKIEEDNPIKFQHSVSVLTMKLFADLELKRRQNEDKISEDARKKREQELEREETKKAEQEFMKNWEDSRQGRVTSWQHFVKGASSSSAASLVPGQSTASYYGASPAASASAVPAPTAVAPAVAAPPAEKKKKKEKQRFSPMGFRPPKHKPESR